MTPAEAGALAAAQLPPLTEDQIEAGARILATVYEDLASTG